LKFGGIIARKLRRGWTPDINQYFKDKNCFAIPDHNAAGYGWVDDVTKNLAKFAHEQTVVELPGLQEGEDLEQWIEGRLKVEKNHFKVRQEFLNLCMGTPPWDAEWRPKLWRDPTLVNLLEEHAILQLKGDVRITHFDDRGVLSLMRKDGFATYYANVGAPVIKAFMQHATRYRGTIISADGKDVGVRLNLWRGFGVRSVKGDWSLMHDHIVKVIANGDKEVWTYILKWIAWAVQNPGRQAEVAIVMRGGKGTGKGALGAVLVKMFGWAHAQHVFDPKHLTGSFNMHLAQCVFLFADEAYAPKDKTAEGRLKGMITESSLFIEPKGVDGSRMPNNLHVLISGNEEWVIPASGDERRFCVTDVSDARRGNTDYWNALYSQMFDNGGVEAILYDMLNTDLGSWHPRLDVPQTAALDFQKARTRSGMDAFIEQVCHDCFLPCAVNGCWGVAVTSGEENGQGLWHYIKTTTPGMRFQNARSLTRTLESDWGCRGGWHRDKLRGITFPSPADLRARFERKHGKQQWNTEAPVDWQDPANPI